MRFYVDECLPPSFADAIDARRGHRAVHSVRDLFLQGRPDEFHIAESRRRREIFVTSNHHDFQVGVNFLKSHPGVVVINPGAWTNEDDLLGGVDQMFGAFHLARIGAKPPFRNSLYECKLVITSSLTYFERLDGSRYDIWPPPKQVEWYHPSKGP